MKQYLNRLIQHQHLTKDEARNVLVEMAEGKFDPHQVASFLTIYMMRPITIEELSGFQEALLDLCLPVNLSNYDPIDLCGTGGDGKDTFNVSTLASFVTAGAGVPVSKHGNYGVSSVCGSSNVMEYLGIVFSKEEYVLKKCLDNANITVLHAPLFHPAMKAVAPIRRALGVKTFFNMLGPLVNPAFPKKQLVGVFSLELARIYGYLYQKTDKNYSVIYALDGYDEASLTGNLKQINKTGEHLLTPAHFGTKAIDPKLIEGGKDVASSAELFLKVLNSQGTEQQNKVVIANAALAISTAEDINIEQAIEKAEDSLFNQKALGCFERLKKTLAEA